MLLSIFLARLPRLLCLCHFSWPCIWVSGLPTRPLSHTMLSVNRAFLRVTTDNLPLKASPFISLGTLRVLVDVACLLWRQQRALFNRLRAGITQGTCIAGRGGGREMWSREALFSTGEINAYAVGMVAVGHLTRCVLLRQLFIALL